MMTYEQFKAWRETRRRAVIRDWWDTSAELQRKRNAGTVTNDDVAAFRLASHNLSVFRKEYPQCCVVG